MGKIILYGAGKRGKKVANLLSENGIEISGFCDSVKTGGKVVYGGGQETDRYCKYK